MNNNLNFSPSQTDGAAEGSGGDQGEEVVICDVGSQGDMRPPEGLAFRHPRGFVGFHGGVFRWQQVRRPRGTHLLLPRQN